MKKLNYFFCLFLMLTVKLAISQNDNIQFIAVHMGNEEHQEVLNKNAFPDFKFYCNTSELLSYSEQQKMMGNPKKLMGWYGEVPEKMGFTANYRGSYGKGYSFPFSGGSLYVIDQEGGINYQIQAERFNEEHMANTYYGIQSAISSAIKKIKKGKSVKKLKANKQVYLKKSPIGTIENSKGAKLDTKNEGLVGWNIPEIDLKDSEGGSISLKELTKGKITVIVFYTLNGAHYLKANTKGAIEKEWEGKKLMSPAEYAQNTESKVVDTEYANKKEAKKGFAKAMFKSAVANSNSGLAKLVFNSKEELDDVERVEAYKQATQNIKLIQEISSKLK